MKRHVLPPDHRLALSAKRLIPSLLATLLALVPAHAGHLTPPATPFTLPEDHPLRLVSIQPDPVYGNLLAMRTNGWLGSDVGESIVLSSNKTLWLFGDTFIGSLSNQMRVPGAGMINSTIAIQDRTKPLSDCMTFYWKERDGKPASFFPHQEGTPGCYYWVSKGVMLREELFLFGWCVCTDEKSPLGFRDEGSVLIRVPNPLDSPDRWIQKVSTLQLPRGDSFHTAAVVKEPFLYLYGVIQPRQTALARVRIEDLRSGRLVEAYEYWVNGPQGPHWGKEATNCVPQFLPVCSESLVHWEPTWKLYTCFTYDAFSPEIYVTVAKDLTGPWSKPAPIYWVPEHHQFSFGIISYAVRQHPELSSKPGEIILTYATNVGGSMKEHFTEEGKDLYVLRFVRVQLELNPHGKKF
jgi:hypothetical protein